MKRSFLALLPGLTGLGTRVITEGRSDVFRSWGLAASGLKLGGLEGLWLGRMECHKGMSAKGVLKNTVSVCVLCLELPGLGRQDWGWDVPCSAEKTFTLFLIPFCFLSCLSWFLCSLLSPLRTAGELLSAPKGSCWYSTRVSDTGSCSLGTWFGGTWQCWVCGCLNDLKALFQPKLFCDSLIQLLKCQNFLYWRAEGAV